MSWSISSAKTMLAVKPKASFRKLMMKVLRITRWKPGLVNRNWKCAKSFHGLPNTPCFML